MQQEKDKMQLLFTEFKNKLKIYKSIAATTEKLIKDKSKVLFNVLNDITKEYKLEKCSLKTFEITRLPETNYIILDVICVDVEFQYRIKKLIDAEGCYGSYEGKCKRSKMEAVNLSAYDF